MSIIITMVITKGSYIEDSTGAWPQPLAIATELVSKAIAMAANAL
jgi:hypothetical protein